MGKLCQGQDCPNEASTLQCPTCQKMGKDSFFCSQDCFKKNWSTHKATHKTQSNILRSVIPPKAVAHVDQVTGNYNPFPNFNYSGPLRPLYPLSPRREVPDRIKLPDHAISSIPRAEQNFSNRNKLHVLDQKGIEAMRKVCRMGREVLDIGAAAIQPGVTTDYIDEVVHKACMERDSYPSPLNYYKFPKSLCTSVNEVICHGIPDARPLQDGDILNLDVSLYHGGYHADLNETYYVGDKARANPDAVRVVEAARECLDKAIELVKPGVLFRDFGTVIEKHAKSRNTSVVKTYCGHGVGALFHGAPNVPHYAKNKAVGQAKPGMTFTIEPMINLGNHKDRMWPDDWTVVTTDGMLSAQFEHTLLVTETGVEILTARLPTSPGGPIPMPTINGTEAAAEGVNGVAAATNGTAANGTS